MTQVPAALFVTSSHHTGCGVHPDHEQYESMCHPLTINTHLLPVTWSAATLLLNLEDLNSSQMPYILLLSVILTTYNQQLKCLLCLAVLCFKCLIILALKLNQLIPAPARAIRTDVIFNSGQQQHKVDRYFLP